ncbi:CoA-binding protein [Blastopirellula marina]|uniref:CoA-binding protein n=1 Tax=Blastopirellula marina TaxID=124 RepID=A0A2S8FLT4_9BACT|nr:CoA-binding protein [Blastopirellula marina]PQO33121.1 CoA-binding protein [Blastopirellula marina]PTL43288.1 CoA-binding protein [Blastopirellula marina]
MSKPTVAILGASAERSKYGNKSVRAHLQNGYDVYPVNPKGGQIEGLKVYTSLQDIPVEQLDRISVYVPPQVGMKMVSDIASKHAKQVFFNPGSESVELLEAARQRGIDPIQACSIVDVGFTPAMMD